MARDPWWLLFDAAAEKVEQRQHDDFIRSELEFAQESKNWLTRWIGRRGADCG